MNCAGRDFLSLGDFSSEEIRALIRNARRAKAGTPLPACSGKTLVAIFFNPSLRTRLSFQVAMERLGGSAIVVNASDRGECEQRHVGHRVSRRGRDGRQRR
jgi:ornithine carbamoyltransferase